MLDPPLEKIELRIRTGKQRPNRLSRKISLLCQYSSPGERRRSSSTTLPRAARSAKEVLSTEHRPQRHAIAPTRDARGSPPIPRGLSTTTTTTTPTPAASATPPRRHRRRPPARTLPREPRPRLARSRAPTTRTPLRTPPRNKPRRRSLPVPRSSFPTRPRLRPRRFSPSTNRHPRQPASSSPRVRPWFPRPCPPPPSSKRAERRRRRLPSTAFTRSAVQSSDSKIQKEFFLPFNLGSLSKP